MSISKKKEREERFKQTKNKIILIKKRDLDLKKEMKLFVVENWF